MEKNCLNCNAQVIGQYCHICGQENILSKESVRHLMTHYFEDITHFDGKFFSSIQLLIFRPGFLSTQYVAGRRSSYLNPIRMYVFTSAIFFLIYFSYIQKDTEVNIDTPTTSKNFIKNLEEDKAVLENELGSQKDSLKVKKNKDRLVELNEAIAALNNVPSVTKGNKKSDSPNTKLAIFSNEYSSTKIYDSVQQKLPLNKRDGWIQNKIKYKIIQIKNKYNDDPNKIMAAILQKFRHSFPQLLFLSLPFFALLLKLLYSSQKQMYYVNHIIFTIHLYCAIFILLLLNFGSNGLAATLHWSLFSWLSTLFSFAIIFYGYKALYNFYQQGTIKTMFKFMILTILMSLIFILLAVILFIFSAYQI